MARRIEIVTECDHGHPRDLAADWSTCIVPECPGGSRRVLDPGSFVEVEWCVNHSLQAIDGECDVWRLSASPNLCRTISAWLILDALAAGSEQTGGDL